MRFSLKFTFMNKKNGITPVLLRSDCIPPGKKKAVCSQSDLKGWLLAFCPCSSVNSAFA